MPCIQPTLRSQTTRFGPSPQFAAASTSKSECPPEAAQSAFPGSNHFQPRQRRPLRLETSKTLLSSTNRAFPWKTLPQLKRYNSYSGAVGEGDFAVYDLHSVEKVVSDQKVAVEVSEVGKRGELGCG